MGILSLHLFKHAINYPNEEVVTYLVKVKEITKYSYKRIAHNSPYNLQQQQHPIPRALFNKQTCDPRKLQGVL